MLSFVITVALGSYTFLWVPSRDAGVLRIVSETSSRLGVSAITVFAGMIILGVLLFGFLGLALLSFIGKILRAKEIERSLNYARFVVAALCCGPIRWRISSFALDPDRSSRIHSLESNFKGSAFAGLTRFIAPVSCCCCGCSRSANAAKGYSTSCANTGNTPAA